MSDVVGLGLQIPVNDFTERYYYCTFSYVFQKTSGFGNAVTKVVVDESNPSADFLPSLVSTRIRQNNNLHSVTILGWQELSSQQYLYEVSERDRQASAS